MKRDTWNARLMVHLLLVVSLSVGLSAQARAREKSQAQGDGTQNPESKHREGGPDEGVKVHGYWTIEVRNDDGTVVSHTEFENSLQFRGKDLLANFLAQQAKPGRWTVVLDNLSGAKACEGGTLAGTFPGLCYMTALDSTPASFSGTNVSRNLKADRVVDQNNGSYIVLSGSIKSLQQGAIDRVYTTLGACDISFQGTCLVAETSTASSSGFSFAFTPGSISVQPGQTIDVTVKFSFS